MSIFEYDEKLHEKTLREEGFEDGKASLIVELVCQKLGKGKTPEVIAEELEQNPDAVKHICKVAASYAPSYDVKEILKHL